MKKELFVPGRTELAGNHTDHQNGRVLASAIDLGLYAVCETNGSKMIHVQSEGFKSFDVLLCLVHLLTVIFVVLALKGVERFFDEVHHRTFSFRRLCDDDRIQHRRFGVVCLACKSVQTCETVAHG